MLNYKNSFVAFRELNRMRMTSHKIGRITLGTLAVLCVSYVTACFDRFQR